MVFILEHPWLMALICGICISIIISLWGKKDNGSVHYIECDEPGYINVKQGNNIYKIKTIDEGPDLLPFRGRELLPQKPKFESYEDLINRYSSHGVHQLKIHITLNPSAVIWSISRKCLVGGVGQPPTQELVQEGDDKQKMSYENNRTVMLNVRSELTSEMVKEINESEEGIIATRCYYDKPYFRYGFIPTE